MGKSRSLPSTPADKPKKKKEFLKKTPLVKLPKENNQKFNKKEESSSEDEDFVPSDVSDEKMDVSDIELNQELAELADEADEFELMKKYHDMINQEEDALEEEQKKKEAKVSFITFGYNERFSTFRTRKRPKSLKVYSIVMMTKMGKGKKTWMKRQMIMKIRKTMRNISQFTRKLVKTMTGPLKTWTWKRSI